MILKVSLKFPPVDVLGIHAVLGIIPDRSARELYIDEKRVPPGLTKIILLGLDVAVERHLDNIKDEMRKVGTS